MPSIFMKSMKDIPSKERIPGVSERLAIVPENTLGKAVTFKHIVFAEGTETKMEMHSDEVIYFVLSGHGIVTVKLPNGTWDREVATDTAIWIPSKFEHSIQNNGEGPMRMLKVSCKV